MALLTTRPFCLIHYSRIKSVKRFFTKSQAEQSLELTYRSQEHTPVLILPESLSVLIIHVSVRSFPTKNYPVI